jgi:hypothetical protein
MMVWSMELTPSLLVLGNIRGLPSPSWRRSLIFPFLPIRPGYIGFPPLSGDKRRNGKSFRCNYHSR